jgi:hypothetical protein
MGRARFAALPPLTRRRLLARGAQAALGLGLLGGGLPARTARAGADDFGPLQPPDANGLMLPPGFSSRVVAVTGTLVGGTGYTWHGAPDGGATFASGDGGWVYVSNSELAGTSGGAGALRFAADGTLVDAYSILTGTARNCAGGPTPWGTWLSCEEVNGGRVFECDPFTPGSQGVLRASLGTFNHEAAAVDPVHQTLYLTEDKVDGLLYRFTPSAWPALGSGAFEAAEILDPFSEGPIAPGQVRPLAWHVVPNPSPVNGGVQNATHLPVSERATRYQVPAATDFLGGEGCWYEAGVVYFSTKNDNRVWRLDTGADEISILYDLATSGTPELSGVDNVYASPVGDVYVAEDGGNLQIVALTPSGAVKPIVQVTGVLGSEITGPALDPSGTRLYFSSQRNPGVTYEVTGPFAPAPAVPLFGGAMRGLLFGALAAAALQALRARRAGEARAQAG